MPTTTYTTADVVKDALTLTGTTFADLAVTSAVAAASRTIDDLCQRRFYIDDDATQARFYAADEPLVLPIDDLVVLASLLTDTDGDGTYETTWVQGTDYVLEPLNAKADVEERPYTRVRVNARGNQLFPVAWPAGVKITGQWGWPQVPDNVTEAATLLAIRFLTIKRQAPLGVLAFPEGGAVRIAKADSQVMMLIGRYMRHRVAVA